MVENKPEPRSSKRRDGRTRVTLPAQIFQGDLSFPAVVEDVGGGGIRFISGQIFDPGDTVDILIPNFSAAYRFSATVIECIHDDARRDFKTWARFHESCKQKTDKLLGFILKIFS